jgi:predicted phosphodiesterase
MEIFPPQLLSSFKFISTLSSFGRVCFYLCGYMLIDINGKRIFAFSDTHGNHRELCYHPEKTDILVCAGDVCNDGNETQLHDFFIWFAEQPAKHKLFVPGNHDLPFDLEPERAAQFIPKGITCVEKGGVILHDIRFYVLPVRPWLHAPLYLPPQIDVLVTHGAPKGILDENGSWGCAILRNLVKEAQPKIHIFGHCHREGGQSVKLGNTIFYNVAM